jgi:hypothetical protein
MAGAELVLLYAIPMPAGLLPAADAAAADV